MIYICEECGFLFYRAGEVFECPSCQKKHIRPAAEKESSILQGYLEKQKCTGKRRPIKEGKTYSLYL